jgi:hypothetical protein
VIFIGIRCTSLLYAESVVPQMPISFINWELSLIVQLRFGPLLRALIASLTASFRSRAVPQLEILALPHQIGVLQCSVKRPKLTPADRLLWAWLWAAWSNWRSVLVIVKPETVVAWHRKAFRLVWTWKVRNDQPGRPAVSQEIRQLIRKMSRDNPLWRASHPRQIAQTLHPRPGSSSDSRPEEVAGRDLLNTRSALRS